VGAEAFAVVAAGVVTPIGADLDAFWASLDSGVDGLSWIERFRVDDLRRALVNGLYVHPRRGDENRKGDDSWMPNKKPTCYAACEPLRAIYAAWER
jgi:3-oxoacyl-(acyl-carrier-protein) synthase